MSISKLADRELKVRLVTLGAIFNDSGAMLGQPEGTGMYSCLSGMRMAL
mgnify:CR=1 FL=1